MKTFSLRDPAFLATVGGSSGGGAATEWAARVVANGGALPSAPVQQAVADFYDGLDAAGLLGKFYTLNCYAPGGIIAASTPLIVGVGNDPWTNGGAILDAAVTVNGLAANGVNQWLDTGVVLASEIASEDDLGMSIYISSGSNSNSAECGINNGAFTQAFLIEASLGSSNSLLVAFSPGSNSLAYANSAYAGYVSLNRDTSTHIASYQANSGTPHALKAEQTAAKAVSLPAGLACFFHATNFGGAAGAPSGKRISFGAIHTALDLAESEAFYTLIQQLRTDFGGGFV